MRKLPLGLKLAMAVALEGFSSDEVGALLGISPSAATVRLPRAKAALQDKLKERSS